MIDLKELFSGLPLPESGSLVGEFKSRLLKEGAKIEEARGAEYFAVSFHGPAVILLAHGSVGHGFWGIRHDIVERCMKTEERFREEGVRWVQCCLMIVPVEVSGLMANMCRSYRIRFQRPNSNICITRGRLKLPMVSADILSEFGTSWIRLAFPQMLIELRLASKFGGQG